MDDELAQLQAALVAVQSQDTKYKLSERNCVEVVTKLIKAQKIALINSLSNDREFLTFDRLENEILDEINAHGGRVSMDQLHKSINVDISYIQSATKNIADSDPDIDLLPPHGSELITASYLKSVATDIGTFLAKRGRAEVADLAQEFSLPLKVLKKLLKTHVSPASDATIQGHIRSNGRIYTEEYMARLKTQTRGVLSGSLFPVSISNIASSLSVDDDTLLVAVSDLLASNVVRGTVEHKTFTPSVFIESRTRHVCGLFQKQKFFSYEKATQMRLKKKELLSMLSSADVFALKTCVVDAALVNGLETTLSATLQDESGSGFVRVAELLPANLTDKDVAACVEHAAIAKGSWHHGKSRGLAFTCCNGQFVVLCAVLDKIVAAFADRESKILASSVASSSSDVAADDHTISSSKKDETSESGDSVSPLREANRGKATDAVGDDDDDDETYVIVGAPPFSSLSKDLESSRGRKKKSKRKKGKRGGRIREEQEEAMEGTGEEEDAAKTSRSKKREKRKKSKKKGKRTGGSSRRKKRGNVDGEEEEERESGVGDDGDARNDSSFQKKKSSRNTAPSATHVWMANMKRDRSTIRDIVGSVSPSLLSDDNEPCFDYILRLVLPAAATTCVALKSSLLRERQRDAIVDQRRLRTYSEKRFADMWELVVLRARGVEAVLSAISSSTPSDKSGPSGKQYSEKTSPVALLRRHLESSLLALGGGEEAVTCLLCAVSLQCGVALPQSARVVEGEPMIADADRNALVDEVSRIDKELGGHVRVLVKSARSSRPNVQSILDVVEALKSSGSCYVKPQDLTRRREKQIVHNEKRTIRSVMPGSDTSGGCGSSTNNSTEDPLSLALRFALLHAKRPAAVSPMERSVASECIEALGSSPHEMWGELSESVVGTLSSIRKEEEDADCAVLKTTAERRSAALTKVLEVFVKPGIPRRPDSAPPTANVQHATPKATTFYPYSTAHHRGGETHHPRSPYNRDSAAGNKTARPPVYMMPVSNPYARTYAVRPNYFVPPQNQFAAAGGMKGPPSAVGGTKGSTEATKRFPSMRRKKVVLTITTPGGDKIEAIDELRKKKEDEKKKAATRAADARAAKEKSKDLEGEVRPSKSQSDDKKPSSTKSPSTTGDKNDAPVIHPLVTRSVNKSVAAKELLEICMKQSESKAKDSSDPSEVKDKESHESDKESHENEKAAKTNSTVSVVDEVERAAAAKRRAEMLKAEELEAERRQKMEEA
eukprot:g4553.t1